MTHVHRCPSCRLDHDRRARCPGSTICDERHSLPLGSGEIRCILDHDHTGPHWGPTPNPDRYHEWSTQ